MRIRRLGLGVAIITIVCFLIEYRFFFLFSYSDFLNRLLYDGRYAILAVVGILLFFYLVTFRRPQIGDYYRWTIPHTAAVIGIFLLFAIYSMVIYPQQKLFDTIAYGGRFACIAWALPMLFLFVRDGGPERLMKYINVIVCIWYVYTILQSFAYAQTGSFLFAFREYYATSINIRNDALRVGQDPFGAIMFLYNLSQLLYGKQKKRVFTLIMVILGGLQIILVQQARMMTISCILCVAVLVMFYGKNKNQQTIRVIAIILGGIILISSPAVAEFLQTFSPNSSEFGGSTVARGHAILYYWEVFLKNPLMGFAWPVDVAYSNIAHSILGTAYTSDVGIVGMLAELGVFSIVIFIIPLIRMIYILRKTKKEPKTQMRMFLIALVVFVMITSLTLIITDPTRCMAFPLVMALFEYYMRSHKMHNSSMLKENS